MNQRKIKYTLNLIAFILAGLMPFQTNLADPKISSFFQEQTYFDYSIYWSFLKVGSAQLSFHEIDTVDENNQKYEIRFSVQSNELVSAIYPVKTHILSTLVKSEDILKPSIYMKKSDEGGKQRNSIVRFDYQLNQVTEEKNQILLPPIQIVENLLDPLSLIVAICQNDFQEKPSFEQAVSDGDQIASIRSSLLGTESTHTSIGEFQTEVIGIDPQGLRGVFKKSPDANVILYLSEHNPAIPIKLKSKVRVGSFYAILSGGMYQGSTIEGKKRESLQKSPSSSQELKRRFKR